MSKLEIMWVDPPSGWLYGFPKNVDQAYHDMGEDKRKWYVGNGYPQNLIDEGMLEYTRVGFIKSAISPPINMIKENNE